MALSYVDYTGDNATTSFSYGSLTLFDEDFVTEASQLRVYVDTVLKTLTTDYSVNFSTNTVNFGSAPATGAKIRIQRYTKRDARYINYTNATNITASILNTDSLQNFFLAQEAVDIQNDAIIVGSDDKWNGRGKILGSIASGVASTDAVNVGQLVAAVSGVTPAAIGNWGYVQYTGDGTDTTFTQPTPTANLDANDLHIFVNGSKKIPVTDYTVDGTTITFTSAPANTHVIQVLWAQGVVGGIIQTGSLTTAMLEAKAVTAAKMNSESATTGHVLKATGSGNCAFGTILASAVSDFDTQVRLNRLDQMATPTAAVSMGGVKITNLATPTASSDASDKAYVDSKRAVQTTTFTTPASGTLNFSANFTSIKNVCAVNIALAYSQNSVTYYAPISFACNDSLTTGNIRILLPDNDTVSSTVIGAILQIAFTRSGTDKNNFSFTLSRVAGNENPTTVLTSLTSAITGIGEVI